MQDFQKQKITVLATDMDGTLIPSEFTPKYQKAIQTLKNQLDENPHTQLGFVTGRRFSTILQAIDEYSLPIPSWIICNQGTAIFENNNGDWDQNESFKNEIQTIVKGFSCDWIFDLISQYPQIEIQDKEHQQEFKTSFWAPGDMSENLVKKLHKSILEQNAPYSIVTCIDPETGRGMIDFLPRDVSKAYALNWLIDHDYFTKDQVVFAGDSGNDREVFHSGVHCILVSNTAQYLVSDALKHAEVKGFIDRLYLAENPETIGLVEGCSYFGWLDSVYQHV